MRWTEYDLQFVRRRYNKLAPIFVVFEWLFLLPPGIRRKAVRRLHLKSGDRVLEIGCGTGRNLSYLVEAIGRDGHVYGVDLSEGMLAKAKELSGRRRWSNVTLLHADAAEYCLPEPVDGAIFSLSYAVMPHRRQVLRHAWNQLKQGGRLIIMDARLPSGLVGRLYRPIAMWLMKLTVLGNPDVDMLDDLRELAGNIEVDELMFGSYFIGLATKPSE
jgi:SAM-dependent methyltransferase